MVAFGLTLILASPVTVPQKNVLDVSDAAGAPKTGRATFHKVVGEQGLQAVQWDGSQGQSALQSLDKAIDSCNDGSCTPAVVLFVAGDGCPKCELARAVFLQAAQKAVARAESRTPPGYYVVDAAAHPEIGAAYGVGGTQPGAVPGRRPLPVLDFYTGMGGHAGGTEFTGLWKLLERSNAAAAAAAATILDAWTLSPQDSEQGGGPTLATLASQAAAQASSQAQAGGGMSVGQQGNATSSICNETAYFVEAELDLSEGRLILGPARLELVRYEAAKRFDVEAGRVVVSAEDGGNKLRVAIASDSLELSDKMYAKMAGEGSDKSRRLDSRQNASAFLGSIRGLLGNKVTDKVTPTMFRNDPLLSTRTGCRT